MVRLGAPRVTAALLVIAGLALAMNGGPPAARARAMKAGYQVLAADFHVHSFPGDGVLPPWDAAVEARRRHLDAIALTNHNAMYSWRLAEWLSPLVRPAGGALVIPGEELTSIGFHLAVVGITSPVPWRQTAASAAAAVHAQGGVAIAAHPGKESWPFLSDADLAALDGVEVAHPMIHLGPDQRRELLAFYARAKLVHPSIAAIGSTDFHQVAPVGLGRTYLLATGATQAAIVDAIRAGRTVACDGLGEAYGPADLVDMVRDDCRLDARSAPEGETARDRLGTWLVWLGLVALVLLGPGRT
jgi:predicted metal-dependent phosphoesterase TrpH